MFLGYSVFCFQGVYTHKLPYSVKLLLNFTVVEHVIFLGDVIILTDVYIALLII